jgi:hypothetical protein
MALKRQQLVGTVNIDDKSVVMHVNRGRHQFSLKDESGLCTTATNPRNATHHILDNRAPDPAPTTDASRRNRKQRTRNPPRLRSGSMSMAERRVLLPSPPGGANPRIGARGPVAGVTEPQKPRNQHLKATPRVRAQIRRCPRRGSLAPTPSDPGSTRTPRGWCPIAVPRRQQGLHRASVRTGLFWKRSQRGPRRITGLVCEPPPQIAGWTL